MSSNSSVHRFNPSESPNYGFQVPDTPSRNLRTFLTYVGALHSWDLVAVLDCFDDALEHRILPQSLGRPVLNKRQYGEYFKGLMPLFKSFQMTIHEVIEADDKMTVHTTSTGESPTGVPYTNESILMIHFVPPPRNAGPNALPRIRLVKEFNDSESNSKFFKEARAREKLRQASGSSD